MLPLLLVTAGALATARLTRLATADQLTLPLRRQVLSRVREGGRLEYLLSCAWCASVWIGAGVAALITPHVAHWSHGGVLLWLLLTLAYSHLTGRWARTEVEA